MSDQNSQEIVQAILRAAEGFRVDINLIKAIAGTESNWNPWAVRYEPHTTKYVLDAESHAKRLGVTKDTEIMLQMTSVGLMQTMGFLCRELGFRGPLLMLTTPEVSIFYGTKHLKRLLDKYKDEKDAISAYNQGSPRKNPDGTYVNNQYVEKVCLELSRLRGQPINH